MDADNYETGKFLVFVSGRGKDHENDRGLGSGSGYAFQRQQIAFPIQ